jgi:glycosyltransferase involved in cell wall biosynthesis
MEDIVKKQMIINKFWRIKMKKVLILNPYIPTLGGGEKHMGYLCQFIEEYYNNDVQVDILVHNYHEEDIHSPNYVTMDDINKTFGLKLQSTSIRKLDIQRSTNKLEYLKNKRIIEKITAEYDLFINFMFFSKHIGKAKTNIYECMFPPKRYVNEMGKGFAEQLVAKFYDYMFYHSYDKFVTNSEYTNHWLGTFWKVSRKNTVTYPPVFSKNEIAGRYEEGKKKNIIISVGRFFVASHSKKQLDLVKFFVNNNEVFKNYEYHLVGQISTLQEDIDYLNEIKRIASTVDNVFIHENCEYSVLLDLYKQAKIFWHGTGYGVDENLEPEKMEHFGITTVEAMSFGAVPVVINKGGQKETVEEGVSGYRWDNEKECVEKTSILMQDDDLRRKMAEISVERSNDYSIEAFYEMNRKVFDELRL